MYVCLSSLDLIKQLPQGNCRRSVLTSAEVKSLLAGGPKTFLAICATECISSVARLVAFFDFLHLECVIKDFMHYDDVEVVTGDEVLLVVTRNLPDLTIGEKYYHPRLIDEVVEFRYRLYQF